MLLLTNLTAQTLQPGQSVTFDQRKIKTGCAECWRGPSSSVKLKARGTYDISFGANVTGATAAVPVQLSIQVGGVTLPETTMISTPATANVFNNVSRITAFQNCCCDFDRVTVTNTGTSPVTVGENSSLLIERRS